MCTGESVVYEQECVFRKQVGFWFHVDFMLQKKTSFLSFNFPSNYTLIDEMEVALLCVVL